MKYFRLLLRTFGNFFMITGFSIIIYSYTPLLIDELNYDFFISKRETKSINTQTTSAIDQTNIQDEDYSNISILPAKPADLNFSVIIPKIEVNAPVVPNVSVSVEKEYMLALRSGVAHAQETALPGEVGNIFLFAHSSLNFWQLGPYATVFNMLKKLEKNDVVILYYKGNAYEYLVYEMDVVPGWDTSPFDAEYDRSVVTLITCDPPGTTLNRRVIKAKLINTHINPTY